MYEQATTIAANGRGEHSTDMTDNLPTQPDFAALDAVAHKTADRRTMIYALIGQIVFSWSNNESMFIYVLMLLMNTDQLSAAITFGTLNTTRARMDLIHRLASSRITDQELKKRMRWLIKKFNESTRQRNEFNHCMFTVNENGEITETHSMRIIEQKDQVKFGEVKKMDDQRISEMLRTINLLKEINREIWRILPDLAAHLR